MKTKICIFPLVLIGVFFLFISCKKNDDSSSFGTVKDADGNVYHTVIIGTQEWMVENLKTTKYNDGSSINLINDPSDWSRLSAIGYCYYNNDPSYKNTYGALYNWYAVKTGRLAPSGWHVPSEVEWETLINYLGGENLAGGKMKETGIAHWREPNTGAANSSGFSALPGGYRDDIGGFNSIGSVGCWWSSTGNPYYDYHAILYIIKSEDTQAYQTGLLKTIGCSVRCVKN